MAVPKILLPDGKDKYKVFMPPGEDTYKILLPDTPVVTCQPSPVTDPNNFGSPPWDHYNGVVHTPDAEIAPDGVDSADRILFPHNGSYIIRTFIGYGPFSSLDLRVWMKVNNIPSPGDELRISNPTSAPGIWYVDLHALHAIGDWAELTYTSPFVNQTQAWGANLEGSFQVVLLPEQLAGASVAMWCLYIGDLGP